jgi:tetratricopeptide (TPR) repeat protein
MGFALGDGQQAASVWTWANQLARQFQENPAVLSMLGDLGNQIRFGANEEFGKTITASRVEPLFRKAMQLQDAGSGTFMRAGDHFIAEENIGEAERCYARSFRLKRNNGTVAIKLASLYRETDRLRDALHVLDVCLREGADNPLVAWEAGLTAFSLERYEVMLTYLDRYRAEAGEQEWIEYYRATGLLEQGDARSALVAIEREQLLFGREGFHLHVIRGCAQAALAQNQDAARSLHKALQIPLCSIDYLSPPGIAALLARSRRAARDRLRNSRLVLQIEERMLQACMVPEELFEELRSQAEVTDVRFFQCLVRQPLDERWSEFPGRWHQDPETPCYLATWGVLATDEIEAQNLVLDWQRRCYPLTPELLETSSPSELFVDSPGIVWQGQRIVSINGENELDDEGNEFNINGLSDEEFDDDEFGISGDDSDDDD